MLAQRKHARCRHQDLMLTKREHGTDFIGVVGGGVLRFNTRTANRALQETASGRFALGGGWVRRCSETPRHS
jgi:hypothetical protein